MKKILIVLVCYRLWDVRKLSDSTTNVSTNSNNTSAALLREYKQHECTGYNVSCSFYHDEKYIITGSEDKCIYIYETQTGKLRKKLKGHPSVVHLLYADQQNSKLLSSCIENVRTINTSYSIKLLLIYLLTFSFFIVCCICMES